MNANRLAGFVIDQHYLGNLGQDRLAVLVVAELCIRSRPYYLLGWNTIDSFGVRTHKVLAATSDDIGFIAVVAQVFHDLEHRLKDKLGVQALEAWVPGARDPVLGTLLEYLDGHAGMGDRENLLEVR